MTYIISAVILPDGKWKLMQIMRIILSENDYLLPGGNASYEAASDNMFTIETLKK